MKTKKVHEPLDASSKKDKFRRLWSMVGNTPMIEIHYHHKGKPGRIFAKCEHYNLTGSVKDRMALYILEKSYQLGLIHESDIIVEATSGNTGIAFAALGRSLGHKVKIIMPDWLSNERVEIIKSLGAEVQLVSKEEGGFLGSIEIAERMAVNDDQIFLPRQFENRYNAEAHEITTAKEIWMQLQQEGKAPDAVIAGVGTGGTIMGLSNYLKKMNPSIRIHPLEPAESPTLSTGYKVGSHRIQGISDEFIPAILELNKLDEIVQVHDGDAIIMAQKLAKELGLAVGISSGANIIGAMKIQDALGSDSIVVTLLPDSNKKYLSTALVKNEPMMEHYVSKEVAFTEYLPVGR